MSFFDIQRKEPWAGIREPHTMPDFDGIFERLDGPELDLPGRDYTELATALRRILQWLVKPSKNTSSDLATMGKRIVCLAWAVDPSIFDGSPSLRQLAREHQQHEKDLRRQVQGARRAIGFTGFGGASRRHLTRSPVKAKSAMVAKATAEEKATA